MLITNKRGPHRAPLKISGAGGHPRASHDVFTLNPHISAVQPLFIYSSQGGIEFSTGSRGPPPTICSSQTIGVPTKLPKKFQGPAATPGRPTAFLLWIRIYKQFRPIVTKAALNFRSDPGGRRRPYVNYKQQGSLPSSPKNFRGRRPPPGVPRRFYFGSAYISSSAPECSSQGGIDFSTGSRGPPPTIS